MKSYPMGVCVATTAKEAAKLHEFMLEQMGGTDECGYEVAATPQTVPGYVYVIYDSNWGCCVCVTMTEEAAIAYCNGNEDYSYECIEVHG